MRINLTLFIQIFNLCISVWVLRRFLVEPLLAIIKTKAGRSASMFKRICDSEAKIDSLRCKTEKEMVKFRASISGINMGGASHEEKGVRKLRQKRFSLSDRDCAVVPDSKMVDPKVVDNLVDKVLDDFT